MLHIVCFRVGVAIILAPSNSYFNVAANWTATPYYKETNVSETE